ncbi:13063_t:CDS:2 [Cetraspora pellucida]|uniref:13063_t:CDS:1 n=1 Tax=Cetraspora pellucida TaxID=1433469 RepID=A0A9N9AFA2_9GLOM|nr:13063_t:CDS:2 [Cetraspora pellucida]
MLDKSDNSNEIEDINWDEPEHKNSTDEIDIKIEDISITGSSLTPCAIINIIKKCFHQHDRHLYERLEDKKKLQHLCHAPNLKNITMIQLFNLKEQLTEAKIASVLSKLETISSEWDITRVKNYYNNNKHKKL